MSNGFDPDVEKELRAWAPLTAIVGTAIFRQEAPQGTQAPYVTWFNVDGIRGANLSEKAETKNVRIQIDCFGSTEKRAREIRDAVADAIDDAGQGDVINDFPMHTGREITRLYQWIVEVDYVVNR